eukprot:GGOE01018726.1.p1 GENE.GGOE01018726.1~~GGOE01018726.1.p1  ORF type:complete len:589 (-),score=177.85 GGOE01018726.1:8-1621(-)
MGDTTMDGPAAHTEEVPTATISPPTATTPGGPEQTSAATDPTEEAEPTTASDSTTAAVASTTVAHPPAVPCSSSSPQVSEGDNYEGRWLQLFADTNEIDEEAVLRIPAADLLHQVHQQLGAWQKLLQKHLAPHGDLTFRSVTSIVALALRLFAPEACRTGADQQLHTAIMTAFSTAQSRFLTNTLPDFLLSGHCHLAHAAVVAGLCARLAIHLPTPAEDLREVVQALQRLEDSQPSARRDEQLEVATSKLHSAIASRATGHPDWAVPTDPEEERRRALLAQALPRREDFFYPQAFHPSQLPVNVVQGLFRSPEDYFDAQYSLLRAEFFSNFIHGVHFKKFSDGSTLFQLSPAVRHAVENGAYLYNNLRVLGTVCHPGLPGDGLAAAVQFRGPDPSRLDWGTTGCLQRGSLVCISNTDLLLQRGVPFSEELFWGVVVDRDPRLLAFGVVVIHLLFHSPAQLAVALDARPPGMVPEPIMLENPLCFSPAQALLRQLRTMREEVESRGPFSSLFAEGEPLLDAPPCPGVCCRPSKSNETT